MSQLITHNKKLKHSGQYLTYNLGAMCTPVAYLHTSYANAQIGQYVNASNCTRVEYGEQAVELVQTQTALHDEAIARLKADRLAKSPGSTVQLSDPLDRPGS